MTEENFWEGRYNEQHRKVHEMEDLIAELREQNRLAKLETHGTWARIALLEKELEKLGVTSPASAGRGTSQ